MRLCSTRTTHYCSLETTVSNSSMAGSGDACPQCWEQRRRVGGQPDRHEPEPREMVGAEDTERRHTGLHEGSISVGAGGGSGPRRNRASSRRRARTAGRGMNNSSLSTATCWRSGLVGLMVSVEAVRGAATMFWRRSAVGRGVRTLNSTAEVLYHSVQGAHHELWPASTRGQLRVF